VDVNNFWKKNTPTGACKVDITKSHKYFPILSQYIGLDII
jgi:hypothetical protein